MLCAAALAGLGATEPADPLAPRPADPVVLPPIGSSPRPATRPALLPTPYRIDVPAPRMAREPRLLKSDAPHAMRSRQATDIPPVAELALNVPALPQLPAGPGLNVSSPALTIPAATIAAAPSAGRPSVLLDPTVDKMVAPALHQLPPPRLDLAPPLFLAIPDPSALPDRFPAPPAHKEDPPVATFDRPSATVLPVAPDKPK